MIDGFKFRMETDDSDFMKRLSEQADSLDTIEQDFDEDDIVEQLYLSEE